MRTIAEPPELEVVADARRAELLLDPLRQRILREASEPSTAAGIARSLKLPPQKVNYHVRTLAEAGFLEPAGEGLKRNLVEKKYRASAKSYVLVPQVLGDVAAGRASPGDELSAMHLMQLSAGLQRELSKALDDAGPSVPTLSFDADVRFTSAEQRGRFARALREALVGVIAQFTSPATPTEGDGQGGRPFRLVVGCYPRSTSDPRIEEP